MLLRYCCCMPIVIVAVVVAAFSFTYKVDIKP